MLECAEPGASGVGDQYPIAGADANSKRAQVNRSCGPLSASHPRSAGCTRYRPIRRKRVRKSAPTCSAAIGLTAPSTCRPTAAGWMPKAHKRVTCSSGGSCSVFSGSRPRRWALKCPDHLFALRDLRVAFPDARNVFVHRDPVKVLLSLCKLTEVLRRPFSRAVDRIAIGRQESARWLAGTERMIRAFRAPDSAEPIVTCSIPTGGDRWRRWRRCTIIPSRSR